MFELTGRQRLTVKRGIRNVGQFLAAEITNPGQNESQQMFASCDWVKEIVVRTNRLTEERGRMIGQYSKVEVAPFSSAEIGIRKSVLKTDVAVNRCANLVPNSRQKSRTGSFRTAVGVTRYVNTVAKIRGEKAERILDKKNWCLQAKAVKKKKKIPLARKRENILRRNPPKS